MNWFEIISLIANLVLGGGLIVTLGTLKATRAKAAAEANRAQSEVKTSELDNVQEAIKIWREMAEGLKLELLATKADYASIKSDYASMSEQVSGLRREVVKLTTINTKMVKLLDKITPDNLGEMVDKIKQLHNES